MSKFSQRLKELRTSHKITQEELATSLQLGGKQIISSYEGNSKPTEPSIDTLIQIANFFEVSVDYLIGVSEIKNHGLSSVNSKLNDLNIFMERFSENERLAQNTIDILNVFLDLVLRHVYNDELLRGYAEILKLINLYDLGLTEEYSSPKVLEGVDIIKYVDGMTVSHSVNSVSEKELDMGHNILKKLIAVKSDYLWKKCESSFCGAPQLDEEE